MGVNLFDNYSRRRDQLLSLPIDEYSKLHRQLLERIRRQCPYDLVYLSLVYPKTNSEKETIKWCDENLQGEYFASIEVNRGPDDSEWIICFELEDDAMVFKLRWC